MQEMITGFNVQINKEGIYRRLRLEENTSSFKNAEECFDDICDIVKKNMSLTGFYCIVNTSSEPSFEEIKALTGISDWVLCFISSNDTITDIANNMMSSGEYLKGYLLNETAVDAFFNASGQLNHMVDTSLRLMGYRMAERYAPGDGVLDLRHQATLLNVLKKHVKLCAYLNECHVLVPERSMLYMLRFEKCRTAGEECVRQEARENIFESKGCDGCSNLKCSYRHTECE